MFLSGLFRKRISLKEGKELLTEYCKENGFDVNTTQWKNTTYAQNRFAYHRKSNKIVSRNWVAFHYLRGSNKYSIWIDLVTKEIRETLR